MAVSPGWRALRVVGGWAAIAALLAAAGFVPTWMDWSAAPAVVGLASAGMGWLGLLALCAAAAWVTVAVVREDKGWQVALAAFPLAAVGYAVSAFLILRWHAALGMDTGGGTLSEFVAIAMPLLYLAIGLAYLLATLAFMRGRRRPAQA